MYDSFATAMVKRRSPRLTKSGALVGVKRDFVSETPVMFLSLFPMRARLPCSLLDQNSPSEYTLDESSTRMLGALIARSWFRSLPNFDRVGISYLCKLVGSSPVVKVSVRRQWLDAP